MHRPRSRSAAASHRRTARRRRGRAFALVASRFNHFIVDRLVDGALDAHHAHGGDARQHHDRARPRRVGDPAGRASRGSRREARSVDAMVGLGASSAAPRRTSTTSRARSRRASPRCARSGRARSRSASSRPTPSSRRSSAPAPRRQQGLGRGASAIEMVALGAALEQAGL